MFPEVRLLKPCGSCCRHFFCQNALFQNSLRMFWNQTVVYRSSRSRISLHKGCIHIPAGRWSDCHMMKGILLSSLLQRKRKRAYAEAVADPLITVLKSCTVLCFSQCAYMSFTNIYIDSRCTDIKAIRGKHGIESEHEVWEDSSRCRIWKWRESDLS